VCGVVCLWRCQKQHAAASYNYACLATFQLFQRICVDSFVHPINVWLSCSVSTSHKAAGFLKHSSLLLLFTCCIVGAIVGPCSNKSALWHLDCVVALAMRFCSLCGCNCVCLATLMCSTMLCTCSSAYATASTPVWASAADIAVACCFAKPLLPDAVLYVKRHQVGRLLYTQ
jgi:hypothetical protein